MQNLRKVSVMQLYMLWKNLSIALLVITLMMTLSKILPHFLSPIISLGCAAYLYSVIYNRHKNYNFCFVVTYTIFMCLIIYTFVAIILNIVYLWDLVDIPKEFVFFNSPYIPSLILNPICFITILVIYLRKRKLYICVSCRITNGDTNERGKTGALLCNESFYLLRNLVIVFGILSAVVWIYYFVFYIKINTNERDWYIFTWLTVITFIFEEVFFMIRYYNLYLDLKENKELLHMEDITANENTTYLRYYVICENNLYIDFEYSEGEDSPRVIDTPFQYKILNSEVNNKEIKAYISQMTGDDEGIIKFYFGRRSPDLRNTKLLRYFYFLDPKDGELPELKRKGEWIDFDLIKKIYSSNPKSMSNIMLADITRLATIVLTSKIFDDEGNRRSRLKSYVPGFNLVEIKDSNLNFQDDKWIKISMFNSDTKFYKVKKFIRNLFGMNYNRE